MSNSNSILYEILNEDFKDLNKDIIYIYLHFSSVELEKLKVPLFYKQVLCAVNVCKEAESDIWLNVNIIRQLMWINCNIKVKGKEKFR